MAKKGKNTIQGSEERTDGVRRDPVYFQTLDFTCGPAALITAMNELEPSYTPSRLEELNIWREANLVFMGEPPAGCGPYGLARAALRRGFEVEIYKYKIKDVFLRTAATNAQAKTQRLISIHDKEEALSEGAKIYKRKLSQDFVRRQLGQHKKLIVLTNHVPDGHWVLVRGVLDNPGHDVVIADPYKAERKELPNRYFTNTGRNVVSYDEFEQWTCHGPEKGTVILALSRKR